MAPRAHPDQPPAGYVLDGTWPHARIDTATAPGVDAAAVQELARRLRAALAGRPLREVAGAAGVAHTTIGAVLAGRRWPEVVTVLRLERTLGAALWPTRPGADGHDGG